MKKIAQWFLYFLVLVELISALTTFSDRTVNKTAPVGIVVGQLAMAGLFFFVARKIGGPSGRKAKDKLIQAMSEETEKWLEKARSDGKVLAPDLGGVLIPRGQKALLASSSILMEMKAERLSGYLGTRVKVGGMPIYVGGSRGTSHKTLKQSSSGQVVLTNEALMFVGATRTMTVKLGDIVGINPTMDSIALNLATRQEPMIFTVANPVLWHTVISAVVKGDIALKD